MIIYLNSREIRMRCDPSKFALAIFSFNRPKHIRALYKTIQDLNLGNRYCFHLFNDGPKQSETSEIRLVRRQTEEFSGSIQNFEIIRRTENLGLAESIRLGLDSVFQTHKKAIILEDDIIPTGIFFEAMEFYLNNQEHNPAIGSVTGANTTKFPLFERSDFLISNRHSSWGWATWADRWLSIDWKYVESEFLRDKSVRRKVRMVSPDLVRYAELQKSGKIDSWATAMNIDFIKRDLFCIVPRNNLILNIGLDGSGTHGANSRGKNINHDKLNQSNLKLKFSPRVKQSEIYNLLVRKDNSLMRNFPTGNILRFLGKLKSLVNR